MKLVLAIIACLIAVGESQGIGTCWTYYAHADATCTGLFSRNVTKSDCCTDTTRGYTTHESVPPSKVGYYAHAEPPTPNCETCEDPTETPVTPAPGTPVTDPACDGFECLKHRRCDIRNNVPTCVCAVDCSDLPNQHRGELCGGDWVTYEDECSLLKSECRSGVVDGINYFGECKPTCSEVQCEPSHSCLEAEGIQPLCVDCARFCYGSKDNNSPICGSDGVTYTRECELSVASCIQGGDPITVAYAGQCGNPGAPESPETPDPGVPGSTCDEVDCTALPDGDRGKLCGSDLLTYTNVCDLAMHNCLDEVSTRINHFGECKLFCSEVQCEPSYQCREDQDGRPRCISCMLPCPPPVGSNNSPICGSDGITYPSECELERASCIQGGDPITVENTSQCERPITCFPETDGQRSRGGHEVQDANTKKLCEQACLDAVTSLPPCYAYDFQQSAETCKLHEDSDYANNVVPDPEWTQSVRSNCIADPAGTCFYEIKGRRSKQGKKLPGSDTKDECEESCRADQGGSPCYAFDFRTGNIKTCYIHGKSGFYNHRKDAVHYTQYVRSSCTADPCPPPLLSNGGSCSKCDKFHYEFGEGGPCVACSDGIVHCSECGVYTYHERTVMCNRCEPHYKVQPDHLSCDRDCPDGFIVDRSGLMCI